RLAPWTRIVPPSSAATIRSGVSSISARRLGARTIPPSWHTLQCIAYSVAPSAAAPCANAFWPHTNIATNTTAVVILARSMMSSGSAADYSRLRRRDHRVVDQSRSAGYSSRTSGGRMRKSAILAAIITVSSSLALAQAQQPNVNDIVELEMLTHSEVY